MRLLVLRGVVALARQWGWGVVVGRLLLLLLLLLLLVEGLGKVHWRVLHLHLRMRQ